MKRKSDELGTEMNVDKSQHSKPMEKYGDPKLLSRIEKLLSDHKDKRVARLDWMCEQLQEKFPEYKRKKTQPFKKSVEKAHQFLVRREQRLVTSSTSQTPDGGNEPKDQRKRQRQAKASSAGVSGDAASSISGSDDDDDDDASFSDGNPDYVTYPDTNVMNNFMSNLYMKRGGSQPNSRPSSQPASPRRPDIDQDGGYVIDRTGTRKKLASSRPASPSVVKVAPAAHSRPQSPSMKAAQSPTPRLQKFSADMSSSAGLSSSVISEESPDIPIRSPVARLLRPAPIMELASSSSSAETQKSRRGVSGLVQSVSSPDFSLMTGKGMEDRPGRSKAGAEKRKSREGTPEVSVKTVKTSVKKKKKEKEKETKMPEVQRSNVTFENVGGLSAKLKEICKLLVHMKHPEVFTHLGITPPRGFLLHGPPGCGKTLLAHAIAGELALPFIKLAATEVVSGVSGESEEKLRDIFDNAMMSAPCVLFIDEIDAITQKRETASKDMERRIVSQLLKCMDDLISGESHVLVIGATNRPDSLDPALRRAGRFDREISLGIPDEHARMGILRVLCRGLRLPPDFDYECLSRLCPGFVGADLQALCSEAGITAVDRVFKALQNKMPILGENLPMSIDSPAATFHIGDNISNDEQTKRTEDLPAVTQQLENVCGLTNTDTQVVGTNDSRVHIDKNAASSLAGDAASPMDVTSVVEDTNSGTADTKCTVENTKDVTDTIGTNSVGPDIVSSNIVCDKRTSGVDKCLDTILESSHGAMEVSTDTVNNNLKESDEDKEFKLVLSWLKDQSPLTERQMQDICITMDDFKAALSHVQPSAKREGFATIPDVTWDDIGALKDVREELEMAIVAPVRFPQKFSSMGLVNPPGILLVGPPGCGKTLLAKAIANESGLNFISVKGPELLNMYVGESERAVRQVFQRARNSAPCVIFFDELDALCPRRSDSGEGGSGVRVVNQLLTEMDGLEERKQVFVMGATNRPETIDPAMLRPGRLDKQLYVGLPTVKDTEDILRTITKNGKKPRLSDDVDLSALAADERCVGYTGADLAGLVRQAARTALGEDMKSGDADDSPVIVHRRHFDIAFTKVRPSVLPKDQLMYKKIQERLSSS